CPWPESARRWALQRRARAPARAPRRPRPWPRPRAALAPRPRPRAALAPRRPARAGARSRSARARRPGASFDPRNPRSWGPSPPVARAPRIPRKRRAQTRRRPRHWTGPPPPPPAAAPRRRPPARAPRAAPRNPGPPARPRPRCPRAAAPLPCAPRPPSGIDLHRRRLLRLVWVLGSGVDLQLLQLPAREAVSGEHPLDRHADDLLRSALEHLAERPRAQSAWIAAVAVIDLVVEFVPGDLDLGRIDHDHEVPGVAVRRVFRLALAAERVGDLS